MGVCGDGVLGARKMGGSLGAGHFPQLKERRAGEQEAAAAAPMESRSPSSASRSQFRGSEPFCRRTCKATVSLALQQAPHRSPLSRGRVLGADAVPRSPFPRPEPLPEGRRAHTARLLSPACVCCTIPAQNLPGTPPSAGRHPLSESKAGIPGFPPQGPFLPCEKSRGWDLGPYSQAPLV